MDAGYIVPLADAMADYFTSAELLKLCELLDVPLLPGEGGRPAYMELATELIVKTEQGNNRRLLSLLVEAMVGRARRSVANSSFERQDHHRGMLNTLEHLELGLRVEGLPEEIHVSEGAPFTAKSKVREFVGQAEDAILVVDNYVGIGTLDCLRDMKQPIRLLTGERDQCIEKGFDKALAAFRAEGFQIDVRRHPKLHDRYLIFSSRVWLVGSSLKDAGQKAFTVLELVDGKAAVVADVEAKWQVATPYP